MQPKFDTSLLHTIACKHMQHMLICTLDVLQRRAPLPWPTHPGCRAGGPYAARRHQPWRLRAKGRRQEQDEEPELEFIEVDEEELAAAEAAATAGRPPEILEEFSNFTPDPPGHKAGEGCKDASRSSLSAAA